MAYWALTGQLVFAAKTPEQMLVHHSGLVKVPAEVPFDRAALLGCAVVTGVGSVVNGARVEAGSSVAVIGCGGIGLNIVQGALLAGLAILGFEPLIAEPGHRLPMLTTVKVPDGVDEAALRASLLKEFGIEIGGGLGPLKGRIIRIGLMGHGARLSSVTAVLGAMGTVLARTSSKSLPTGAALEAALAAHA